MRAAFPLILALLVLSAGTVSAEPGVAVHETAHYRVEFEGTPAEAALTAKVLEAAWTGFADFFGAKPRLGKDESLRVYVGRTRASFEARLRADRAAVPKSGGYYSPRTKTAYLWVQPTIYYTRCLLIHEASHQFHYLSRTGNRTVGEDWYVEGLAEFLCRHTWDGERLVLGALPVLSLKDYAAAARLDIASPDFDLKAVVEGKAGGRPVWWALVRFLVRGEKGRLAGKFRELTKRVDRGADAARSFRGTVGDPKKLAARLRKWIETEQEPWAQIWNQWEGEGPGAFRGTAPHPIVSACRAKAGARRIEAEVLVPNAGRFNGGLLLHYEDGKNYTVALVRDGKRVRVDRMRNGKWQILLTATCPSPRDAGVYRLRAERRGAKVALFVEGKEIGAFEAPGETLGLALQGSTLRFRGVSFE